MTLISELFVGEIVLAQHGVYRHKRIESYIGFEHVFLSLGLGGTPSQSKLLYGVCSGSVMHRTLAPRQDGAMHQVSFAFIKGFT